MAVTDLLQVVLTRQTQAVRNKLPLINLLATCRWYHTCWNNLLRVRWPHQLRPCILTWSLRVGLTGIFGNSVPKILKIYSQTGCSLASNIVSQYCNFDRQIALSNLQPTRTNCKLKFTNDLYKKEGSTNPVAQTIWLTSLFLVIQSEVLFTNLLWISTCNLFVSVANCSEQSACQNCNIVINESGTILLGEILLNESGTMLLVREHPVWL
jgi:hypothetical protein